MNGLRDITQQCGQPTALSQLSTNITATNPNILADAQVYKQAPQQGQGVNPLDVQQNVPTAQNLMHDFNQQKPMQPMPIPMPMPQQMNKPQNNQQNQQQNPSQNVVAQLPPHQQMQMAVQPQIHHIPQPMMMQMPQQMFMPQYQIPPQMYQQMMNMNIQQQQEQPVNLSFNLPTINLITFYFMPCHPCTQKYTETTGNKG